MVDAVSLSANGFRVSGLRPAASAAPATLSPAATASPVAQAEATADIGDLDFLYAPGGQPQSSSGRLAVTSDTLTALLTSLMQPAAGAGGTENTGGSAAPTGQAPAGPSVITRLYDQF
jgi:hypothetical protein